MSTWLLRVIKEEGVERSAAAIRVKKGEQRGRRRKGGCRNKRKNGRCRVVRFISYIGFPISEAEEWPEGGGSLRFLIG